MKIFKLSLLALPIIFLSPVMAQETNDISNPGTGTFSVQDSKSKVPESNLDSSEIQRQEEEVDSFGADKFNENVNPDEYEVDDESKEPATP